MSREAAEARGQGPVYMVEVYRGQSISRQRCIGGQSISKSPDWTIHPIHPLHPQGPIHPSLQIGRDGRCPCTRWPLWRACRISQYIYTHTHIYIYIYYIHISLQVYLVNRPLARLYIARRYRRILVYTGHPALSKHATPLSQRPLRAARVYTLVYTGLRRLRPASCTRLHGPPPTCAVRWCAARARVHKKDARQAHVRACALRPRGGHVSSSPPGPISLRSPARSPQGGGTHTARQGDTHATARATSALVHYGRRDVCDTHRSWV
jgi:hypothetical protein